MLFNLQELQLIQVSKKYIRVLQQTLQLPLHLI